MIKSMLAILLILLLGLAGCTLPGEIEAPAQNPLEPAVQEEVVAPQPTPFPTRPRYAPGELVPYVAQTGDTLENLARRFNSTVQEIRDANPIVPPDATTMPPGMPMEIPIYYLPLWGSPFQILPDWLYVNGPSAFDFDTAEFVSNQPGWLKDQSAYVAGENRQGGAIIDYVSLNFSIDPRLLLAILEYQVGALSNPEIPENIDADLLGYRNPNNQGLYLQLVWAANRLNNGYYGWRSGKTTSFDLLSGALERPDPWQNAGSVAIQFYFSAYLSNEQYQIAIAPEGLYAVYTSLFGSPWENSEPHIPGSLTQPYLRLPFEPNKAWAYTGGPHTGWGVGEPFAGLDFAPPSTRSGCFNSDDWVTAPSDGVIVRSETGIAVLDLDGDNDERTGWVLFFLHLATEDRAKVGDVIPTGGRVGHPSCEGGTSTGTHVHIARKFNGEWILAGSSVLPFNLDGWIAQDGVSAYQGTLLRAGKIVKACECSNAESRISSDE